MRRMRKLDLQAKIILVLVGVILPTYLIVTVAENKLTQPILDEEMKQVGLTTAKTLAAEVLSQRFLTLPNPTPPLEKYLQEFLYSQPSITRIDILVKDPLTGSVKAIASSGQEEPGSTPLPTALVEKSTGEYKSDEQGSGSWEIFVPIEQRSRDSHGLRRVLGNVHVVISMKVVERLMSALWKVTAFAAAFSVVILILALSFFLRRTIENDRLLRQAESQNLELTEQLHEAQRQLMNTEKLAVMGQLTASFAHEVGTPLNALGGHLQLLREEIKGTDTQLSPHLEERFEIITGQLGKIESIVKGFLQSTAKPPSQRQLVDLNQMVDRALAIVQPRILSLGVLVRRDFDRKMGPIRAVPLELEQVILNLVNNSLDSLKAKGGGVGSRKLEIQTRLETREGNPWAVVSVYDTGEGIAKADLQNVLKPFFTTKRPGEGTGLGLAICKELVRRHGGRLDIDSKEGAWTRVTVDLPYRAYYEDSRSG